MIRHLKIFLEKNKTVYNFFRKVKKIPIILSDMIKTLSLNNLKSYLYPINPPENVGYITQVNKYGISGLAIGENKTVPLKVDLFVDGVMINSTYASQKLSFPTKYRNENHGFYFPMNKIWQFISPEQKIEIKSDIYSFRMNADRQDFITDRYKTDKPKQNIVDLIEEGRIINKFGKAQIHRDNSSSWLNKVTDSYIALNDVFEKEAGVSLFIFYGTMLGYAREGGVMAHDCDLDLAYFSEKKSPEEVREEFFKITQKMAQLDLALIPFNYKMLFKKLGLSVTPCWVSGDGIFSSTFGYVGDGFTVTRDDILPLKKVEFGTEQLYLPNNAVNVSKYIYGRGWKYPDPGWKWLPEYKNHKPVLEGRLSLSQVRKLEKLLKRN